MADSDPPEPNDPANEPAKQGYSLLYSFDIDHGELDGLRRKQCFVLGVEWQLFVNQLETGKAFSHTVRTENRYRLTDLAASNGRGVMWKWFNDDWGTIDVSASPFKLKASTEDAPQ